MADKNKENEEILIYGVDFKNRRIYFGVEDSDDGYGGGFHWSSIEGAIRALHRMSSTNNKPIELHMSSPGGCPYEMLRLYDEIQACPCKIVFVGGGQVCSSATWIMAGCDERLLHKHTTVLLHDGSESYSDRFTDFQIYANQAEKLQDLLYKLYTDNSRMPYEFWADLCQRDLILTADETIMLGLADKIIEPKKRGNLRRSRIACLNKEVLPKELRDLTKSLYKRTRRTRLPSKIEIVTPTEEFDKNVFVEETTESEPLKKDGAASSDQSKQECDKSSADSSTNPDSSR